MKRRRTLIVSLLLVTALCMGIGYAATSGNLTVTGTATIDEHPFEVNFIGTNLPQNTTGATYGQAIAVAIEGDTPSESAPLKSVAVTVKNLKDTADSVSFTLTIKNDNEFAVTIAPAVTSSNTYLDVDASSDKNELDAGGTATLTVTVGLKKEFYGTDNDNDAETTTESFTVTVTASQKS